MYREFTPPPGLAALACVWIGDDRPVRVLPDGCVDVVFAGGRLTVAGPATRAQLAPATPGQPRCGVRFRVGAAGIALGVPADVLLDQDVELTQLWGPDGRRLQDRVAGADRPALALLQGVAERLPADLDRPVRAAVLALAGGARVPEAADRAGFSERQLRRRLDRAVGYGPATLVRVLRLQRFLRLAAREPDATLAGLAAGAGYADQAHLARECRGLSGLPPSQLLATRPAPAGEPGRPVRSSQGRPAGGRLVG